MGCFKEQSIDVMNEQEQVQKERELVEKLKMSFPKLHYTIEQAFDCNELHKVINLIEALETNLEQV